MKRVLLGCLLCALMMTPSFSKGKKMVIFVDNFVNLSSKEYDHFGAGIGKTVSNDFSYVPEFTVISFSDREEALNEIAFSQSGATKTEIKPGQMLAADYTCTGKYQIKGEDLAIHASFIDVRKRKPVVSVKIIGTIHQMREKQDQIVFKIIEELKKKRFKISDIGVNDRERMTKTRERNEKAYDYYCRGLKVKYTDPGDALTYFQKAVNIDGEYADALTELADLYADHLSRFKIAAEYIDKAASVLQKRNETQSVQYARVMNVKGNVYYNLSKYQVALDSYNAGLNILENLGKADGVEYAELLNDIGNAYKSWGKYDQSRNAFEQSLKIKEKLGMSKSLPYAITLNNMAWLYFSQGNGSRALEYNKKAMKLKRDIKMAKSRSYAISLNNEAILHFAGKNFSEGYKSLEKSQKILQKLGLSGTKEYAYTLVNMGYYCSAHLKDYEKARKNYEDAQDIRKRIGQEGTLAYAATSIDIARVYHKRLGNSCAALPWMEKGMQIKRDIGAASSSSELSLMDEIKAQCGK